MLISRISRISRMSMTALLTAAALFVAGLGVPPLATAARADNARGVITWHDCSTDDSLAGFECGTLTVPLDWDNLDNPANAEIELAVHRATSNKRIGALTFNPGGPGESGLELATPLLGMLPAKVRNQFDFVAWDPRGVGLSQPQLTGCMGEDAASGSRAEPYLPPATGPVDWMAYAESQYAGMAAGLAACLEANPDVAPYLGTYYVIRDLDAMRAALGEEQWNFWGMSYGTRIGYRYAREFPDRLRTLVLDGSWSPNLTVTSWMNGETWNYATAQAVFSSQFGKKMGYRLQRVIDGLDERTITVDGVTYTRWMIVGGIFGAISYESQYADVLDLITLAYNGLYAPTAKKRRAAARGIAEPLERLQQANPSASLNIYFINCRDLGDYPTPEEIGRTAAIAAANNSVAAGNLAIAKGVSCAGLPEDFTHGYTPLTTSLRLPIKPVVVNSLGDTRTEYDFGRTMANFLWGSSLITYDSTQHVSYLQTTSTCINTPVTTYLLSQTAPGNRLCALAGSAVPSS